MKLVFSSGTDAGSESWASPSVLTLAQTCHPPINIVLVIFCYLSLSLSLLVSLALFFFDCIKSDKKIRNFQFNQEHLKGNIFRLYMMIDLNSPIDVSKEKAGKEKRIQQCELKHENKPEFSFYYFPSSLITHSFLC